jgi:ATP-binding protein involved in chromosome partitioning
VALSEQTLRDALAAIPYPGFSRDIVASGVVRAIVLEDGDVRVELDLGTGDPSIGPGLIQAAETAIRAIAGVRSVKVGLRGAPGGSSSSLNVLGNKPAPRGPSIASRGAVDSGLISEVRHTVAIASGKGGVGKSTVAVNLAIALSRLGMRVGLLDADIYGPSIPLMMGLQGAPPKIDNAAQKLIPFEKFGVRFMSIGFLSRPDQAVIWRGPLVMKAVEQLLRDVDWGPLDFLIVDMPPGTGDVQLTLSQRIQLAGAVMVTTPQDVAMADVIKAIDMFRKVKVPVLGLIENMSYYTCPHCSERAEIFGHGGGREQAEKIGVPFFGEIPLDVSIRTGGDNGTPVASDSNLAQGNEFTKIAEILRDLLSAKPTQATGGIFERFRDAWSGNSKD